MKQLPDVCKGGGGGGITTSNSGTLHIHHTY